LRHDSLRPRSQSQTSIGRLTMGGEAEISIENAPVSYAAFERTIGLPGVPTAEAVLTAVAEAGYDGIDLGPVGYLGRGDGLRRALTAHRLGLAGGYVELPFSDPARLRDAWSEL